MNMHALDSTSATMPSSQCDGNVLQAGCRGHRFQHHAPTWTTFATSRDPTLLRHLLPEENLPWASFASLCEYADLVQECSVAKSRQSLP